MPLQYQVPLDVPPSGRRKVDKIRPELAELRTLAAQKKLAQDCIQGGSTSATSGLN